jgi:hypothetical protein
MSYESNQKTVMSLKDHETDCHVTVAYNDDGSPFSVLISDSRHDQLVQLLWSDYLRMVSAVKYETDV